MSTGFLIVAVFTVLATGAVVWLLAAVAAAVLLGRGAVAMWQDLVAALARRL